MITRQDVIQVMAETVAERTLSIGCRRNSPALEREQKNDEDDFVIKALMRWRDRAFKPHPHPLDRPN